MKPTIKQLGELKHQLATKRESSSLSNAEISKFSGVHQSQVGRICSGNFKTFSHNVLQICRILDVSLPSAVLPAPNEDPAWAQVQSSIRDLWDETPEGAKAITQMIDAIVRLSFENRR